MKRNFCAMLTFLLAAIFCLPHVNAAPSIVMLKFSDDTRFDALNGSPNDPGVQLSERILKILSDSKKFVLQSREPLNEDIEANLYDEKVGEYNKFLNAVDSNNYSNFFESDNFSEKKAQSIATAQVGQFISPEITSKIGTDHNTEYLIQGTIINLGKGNWLSEDLEFFSSAVSQYVSVAAAYGSNVLGMFGNFGEISVQRNGIGIQCDVRVIKATTGEVVWSKRITSVAEQNLVSVGPVTFGHSKMSPRLYEKAIDKAADKIAKALLADMAAGKVF